MGCFVCLYTAAQKQSRGWKQMLFSILVTSSVTCTHPLSWAVSPKSHWFVCKIERLRLASEQFIYFLKWSKKKEKKLQAPSAKKVKIPWMPFFFSNPSLISQACGVQDNECMSMEFAPRNRSVIPGSPQTIGRDSWTFTFK